MSLERIGRIGVRWITRYRFGWTVYDQRLGVLGRNLTESQAREWLP